MKKHKIVVELSTDDDAIAELYENVNSIGSLSELVEKLVYLHLGGFYSASYKSGTEETVEKPAVIEEGNQDVVDVMKSLRSVIEDLQETVKGNMMVPGNVNNANVQLEASATVDPTPIVEEEVEIIAKVPKKRKGKRDLSKLKKLKGG